MCVPVSVVVYLFFGATADVFRESCVTALSHFASRHPHQPQIITVFSIYLTSHGLPRIRGTRRRHHQFLPLPPIYTRPRGGQGVYCG